MHLLSECYISHAICMFSAQDEQSDSWILSDPVGVCRKLSESLVLDSDRKSSDVGKYRNGRESCRNQEVPTLSDVRRLSIGIQYQGFRQTPIGSDRVRLTWVCFFISLWLLYIKYMYYICIFVSISDGSH